MRKARATFNNALSVNRQFANPSCWKVGRTASVHRLFSTQSGPSVVDLNHQIIEPSTDPKPHATEQEKQTAVIVMHGLFGSSLNWRSICRQLAKQLACHFFLLDMRNHGASPWHEEHTTEAMVADVKHFIEKEVSPRFPNVSLIGHSMGGKVAMTYALKYPEAVQDMVVVDVAPISYPSVEEHMKYINLMKQLDLKSFTSRGQIDKFWLSKIPDEAVRSFLLSNLTKIDEPPGWQWKINIPALEKGLVGVRDFNIPQQPHNNNTHSTGTTTSTPLQFPNPTLFLGGEASGYIPDSAEETIKELFPRYALLKVPGAGHWVHFTHSREFSAAVLHFFDVSWSPEPSST